MRSVIFLLSTVSALFAQADFVWKAEITVEGYGGSSTLSGFPVLVRLSPQRLKGFNYEFCQDDGKDIRFTSTDGSTVYHHEIEYWNPAGESLVWVKIPEFTQAAKFNIEFGDPTLTASSAVAKKVWSGCNGGKYIGVWHMSEIATAENAAEILSKDSAKAFPSKGEDWMNAVPTAINSTSLSGMISVDGIVGYGRQNHGSSSYNSGSVLQSGKYGIYDASVDPITVSGWFNIYSYRYGTYLLSNKPGINHSGFGIALNAKSTIEMHGGGAGASALPRER